MINLKNIKNQAQSAKSKFNSAGVFNAIVADVRTPDDYVEGEAFEVIYDVETPKGTFPFRELFFMKRYNRRTQNFLTYLSQSGIDIEDITSFIGCQEKLTFKRVVVENRSRLNIVSREFISKDAEGFDDMGNQ